MTSACAVFVMLIGGWVVVSRARDLVRDLYLGTGNRQWFAISAGTVFLWSAIIIACVLELAR